jgi:hypothetical protein
VPKTNVIGGPQDGLVLDLSHQPMEGHRMRRYPVKGLSQVAYYRWLEQRQAWVFERLEIAIEKQMLVTCQPIFI